MHLRLLVSIIFSLFVTDFSGTCNDTWQAGVNSCDDSNAVVSETADGATDGACCVCIDGFLTSVVSDVTVCLKQCDNQAGCDATTQFIITTQACAADPCTTADTNCCGQRVACDSGAGCDLATKYIDTNELCAVGVCASTDAAVCCKDRAQCDSNVNCDTTTKYLDTTERCAVATCADTDTNCCKDRATCDIGAECDTITQFIDTTQKCAVGTCADTDTSCCKNRAQCAGTTCEKGRVRDDTKYCATDSCTQNECCTDYELGDLVLHMTVSFVSALFLSIALYFFTNSASDLSSYELVPLVTSRRKRHDF